MASEEQLEIGAEAPALPMRLWEATRWGNDADGGNGPDTNYLVVAPDHEAAARVVAAQHADQVSVIFELGLCTSAVAALPAHVARGPYVAHKLNGPAHFTQWDRDEEIGAWVPTPSLPDGVARCAYASGARAAEVEYLRGRKHGRAERWYPDGTPLSRESYRHGATTGVCEWWYPGGRPAARFEHVDVSRQETEVTETRWNVDGEVVRQRSSMVLRPKAR